MPTRRCAALLAAVLLAALASAFGQAPPASAPRAAPARRVRLPKPEQLDRGAEFHRDPATGELLVPPAPTRLTPDNPAAPAIRLGVNLVEVGCSVAAPDGSPLRGLSPDEFRVIEDGVVQRIAYFDASTEPLHLALVIDASPSVIRDQPELKGAARALLDSLAPTDQVAVVAFSAHVDLELPFSADRDVAARAVAALDPREFFFDRGGSNIYEAVYLTVRRLFGELSGRKAIALLTDGQDSGLGLTWDPASAAPRGASGQLADRLTFEDVARLLAASGVEAYVISTENRPRVMTAAWLAAHQSQFLVTPEARELGMPNYTLYLAELVRRAGGQIYFLREVGSLAEAYRRIAGTLRAQYTLGYYPSPAALPSGETSAVRSERAGWHSLRVELRDHPGARLAHRLAYYVPAP